MNKKKLKMKKSKKNTHKEKHKLILPDEKILERIYEKYKKHKGGAVAWTKEKTKVAKLVKSIQDKISPRYFVVDAINIGGTAVVLQVYDDNLRIYGALKFPRPVENKEEMLTNTLKSEISRLIESSHENIVSIYYKNEVKEFGIEWPFYIMEYIKDVVDAKEYLTKKKPDYKCLLSLIHQITQGLVFLHSKNTIHLDIKFENVLVSPDGTAKISDLGSARAFNPKEKGKTLVVFTSDWAHPDLKKGSGTTMPSDPNRIRREKEKSQLKKEFDLYALGQNILWLLSQEPKLIELPQYEESYLRLMACRMLDGHNTEKECGLIGLPISCFKEIKYNKIEDVLLDIKKVTGEYALHESIREIDHHFPRTIQITSPGTTSFTKRVANILASPFFRRLASVSQLGLIIQIYPSAAHSRLEHVLGTFANIARYCDSLWNDPINPLFRQIMTEHDINLILLTALCHDIGQYPLAHDFEGAEKTIFSHKRIGKRLLTSDFKESKELDQILYKDWGVRAKEIAELLDTKAHSYDKPLKMRLLSTMIDGPIDADKIDYLIRDSNHLNVPYGKCIDIERLFRCLTVIFKNEYANNVFISLGIHEKGKIPAESVAYARYAMFGSVYWHHTSRSAKSMLHRAVWEALENTDDKNKMQDEFLEELVNQGRYYQSRKIGQLDMFPKKVNLVEIPQLAKSDYEILQWLASKTSKTGIKLLEMVCARQLFKRLLVLSHRRNSKLWEDLRTFKITYEWPDYLKMQRQIQKKIIECLKNNDDKGILNEKNISSLLSVNDNILILVDIADERSGSSSDLYFLPEKRLLSSDPDDNNMEDSLIWTELARNFVKSVGKIRVFCHPDLDEYCKLLKLSKEDIIGAIETSLSQFK